MKATFQDYTSVHNWLKPFLVLLSTIWSEFRRYFGNHGKTHGRIPLMCFICSLVSSAIPYQLLLMTTLSSCAWAPKFLVLPWLSGKSLHTATQSSTKSQKVLTARGQLPPPGPSWESPQKHGANWTAHRLSDKARPYPWFVQRIAQRKIPVVAVDTTLIKKASIWNGCNHA